MIKLKYKMFVAAGGSENINRKEEK